MKEAITRMALDLKRIQDAIKDLVLFVLEVRKGPILTKIHCCDAAVRDAVGDLDALQKKDGG